MTTYADRLFSRKYARARHQQRREEHRCFNCNVQDERTLSGKAYCAVCAEKTNVRHKAWYDSLKAEHRCVKCGRQDERTLSGKTCCAVCSEERNAYYRAEYRKKKAAKTGDADGQQN